LGNKETIVPRLAVPFQTWAALLENHQSRHRLYQQRQTGNSAPVVTQLGRWFQGQIDDLWQTLDRALIPQTVPIAVRSGTDPNSSPSNPHDISRAKIYDLGLGQIALILSISPLEEGESRINIKVQPAGGATYLPGETQLRLLTIEGNQIGQISAPVTETIQLQFRASPGEQFQIEISCEGETLTEVFEL
jgi:hypothetical protein